MDNTPNEKNDIVNINDVNPSDISPAPNNDVVNINDVNPYDIGSPEETQQADLEAKAPGQLSAFIEGIPGAKPVMKVLRGVAQAGASLNGPGGELSPEQLNYFGQSPEGMAANEAAYPGTELLGGLAAIPALGELPLVGGLFKAYPGATAGARIAGTAVQGAIAAPALTALDDWSENKPLDAERIMAATGFGFLVGGAGASIGEGLSKYGNKVLSYFNDANAPDLPPPGSPPGGGPGQYVQNVMNSARLAGKDINDVIPEFRQNIQDLEGLGAKAGNQIYDAADFHINNALEAEPTTNADVQNRALGNLGEVDSILNEAAPTSKVESRIYGLQNDLEDIRAEKAAAQDEQGFAERNYSVGDPRRLELNEEVGNLSRQEDALLDKIQPLQEQMAANEGKMNFGQTRMSKLEGIAGDNVMSAMKNAQQAILNDGSQSKLASQQALRRLATAIDDNIKFNAAPTPAQEYTQSLLRRARVKLRGNLSDPGQWGEAANVYKEVNGIYSDLKATGKNMNKRLLTKIATSKGDQYITDPAKAANLLKNPNAPGQALRFETLNNRIGAVKRAAEYGENYSTYQSTVDDLTKKLDALKLPIEQKIQLGQFLNQMKTGQKGAGSHLLLPATLIENLSIPWEYKAALGAAYRWATPGGSFRMGHDLGAAIKGSAYLAKLAAKTTKGINGGVAGIVGKAISR